MHATTLPWDAALRSQLVELGQGADLDSLDAFGVLDTRAAAPARGGGKGGAAKPQRPRAEAREDADAEKQRRLALFEALPGLG